MKLFEMEGFLRGKCLPGDMLVNETNAEYLVRKISGLQAQVNQLAAENSALKSAFAPKEIPTEATDVFSDTAILKIDGDEFHSSQWVDNETDVIRAVLDFFKPETPATDAILAPLHAEGVEMYANNVLAENMRLSQSAGMETTASVFAHLEHEAKQYAAQLRSKSEVQS